MMDIRNKLCKQKKQRSIIISLWMKEFKNDKWYNDYDEQNQQQQQKQKQTYYNYHYR